MWILGRPDREFLFLYLPGLISVLVAIMFPQVGDESLFYALLATAVIDSGHVYTTSWRTFLHPQEMKSSKRYLTYPVIIFAIFFLWHNSGIKGLWSFIVYATLFHHVRQVYGFSKWYQGLNKRSDSTSDYFLYTLCVFPMIAYHFREGVPGHYYSDSDLFLYPNNHVVKACYLIYAALLAAWIIREMRLWKSGTKELNRLLSVGFPALVYGYCFFVARTFSQVLFPLLFIHGVPYIAVLSQTLHRTRKKRFGSFITALLIVGLTALIFGLGESWVESNIISSGHPANYLTSFLVGLWLTPLFCHYVFDAIIWKRNHRESALVLGKITD